MIDPARDSGPLRMLSSMATRGLLQTLVEQYQRESGIEVQAEADGGVKVAARVRNGELLDLVVLAEAAIEELIGEGKLIAGTRVDLVRSGVAVAVQAMAVQAGRVRPDVSSPEALRQTVQAARSIAYSTGPSGRYLEQLFARWGILESIRSRTQVAPPGTPVASLIAAGAVELGFQQLSELLGVPGIRILGPLPDQIQIFTVFSGAISATSSRQRAAAVLLEYLRSPRHAATLRRFGMALPGLQ